MYIDVQFDFRSDTPEGKDADTYSSTLRNYHKLLWSKNLPNGERFNLDLDTPHKLHHNSSLGEFMLSSDAITHTYKNWKSMSNIIDGIPREDMETFYSLGFTIGAFIIFPSKRINKKMTINMARGTHKKIRDRFDLTLECIRRYYVNKDSPLKDTIDSYSSFFNLFETFRGYVDFFLLQDLVDEEYKAIKFWHSFDNFNNQPLPNNIHEYNSYKNNVVDFIKSRNIRILKYFET